MKRLALFLLLLYLCSAHLAAQDDVPVWDHVHVDSTRNVWHVSADCNDGGLWAVVWSERTRVGATVHAAFLERGQRKDIRCVQVTAAMAGIEDARPSVTFLTDSTVLVAWQRREALSRRIYAAVVQRDGVVGGTFPVQQVQADGMMPATGRCLRDGLLVAWQDYRNGNADVYARYVADDGTATGPDILINDDAASAMQGAPRIARDNRNGHLLVWPDNRADRKWKFYYHRIGATGSGNVLIDSAQRKAMTTIVSAVCVSEDTAHIFWKDYREGDSNIYRRIVDLGSGTFSPAERINDDVGDRWQRLVVAAGDRKGNTVACWEDHRNTENNQRGDIYLQVFDRDGMSRGRNIKVNDRNDRIARKMPVIAMDGGGWYLLLWHQGEQGTFTIAGQWFRYPAHRVSDNFLLTGTTK